MENIGHEEKAAANFPLADANELLFDVKITDIPSWVMRIESSNGAF
jgi:hypothetical protein